MVLNKKEIQYFMKYESDEFDKCLVKGYPDFSEYISQEFKVGELWGGKDRVCWFVSNLKIPDFKKGQSVYLEIVAGEGDDCNLSGSESMIYINSHPVQGIDKFHSLCKIDESFSGSEIEFALKSFSGLENDKKLFSRANIITVDTETESLFYRTLNTFESLKTIDKDHFYRIRLLSLLNDTVNIIDYRIPGSAEFNASVKKANDFLKSALKELKLRDYNPLETYSIGHAHIDVAWLWRLKHTREKSARSFSTVLKLMKEYPEYKFLQSMPQLYEFVKEDYPEIYAEIKNMIKDGRWEVNGGMWVEADCNIPSGESLVRQFLYGINYFKEEFDVKCKTLWLPDVFGYSWALPQIIKKCGLEYFMTTKISWNQFNRPEYDTFEWKGIDGTKVLTHFITAPESEKQKRYYTYNGDLRPESVIQTWKNYRQKDSNEKMLIAFGWGDGGGGPTKEMLESAKMMNEIPGIPQIKMDFADKFFSDLEESVNLKKLPVIDGELYLEYHRGTFTSQAKIKKNNRKTEIKLHDVEFLSSFADYLCDDFPYPKNELDKMWKTLLKNQFHDILPGSSIEEVYRDSESEFEEIFKISDSLIKKAMEYISRKISPAKDKIICFNTLPWNRDEIITLNGFNMENKILIDENGEIYHTSKSKDGRIMTTIRDIPGYGFKTLYLEDVKIPKLENNNTMTVEKNLLENRYFRILLNSRGEITSLYDKETDRELIEPGKNANCFKMFEDRPIKYDAWDIDIYYQQKEFTIDGDVNVQVEENGPDRGVLSIAWKFFNNENSISYGKQKIIIYPDSRRIDFPTEIDWHEHQILLKSEFPLTVRSTKATYEIQFGNVERPTHWNTSWDYAKFESLAHKWADLSARDYGMAILNDCKYGYDIKDNVMRITLIKSGIYPDENADQGKHEFTYSIMPHGGDWFDGDIQRSAYELNYPVYTYADTEKNNDEKIVETDTISNSSFVYINSTSSVLDTIKKSEDGKYYVLRIYEYGNRNDDITLQFTSEVECIEETDLLEETVNDFSAKISKCGKEIRFRVKPFEIKTLKFRLK